MTNAHSKKLYFSKNNLPDDVEVGEIVELSLHKSPRGFVCKNIKKVNIDEDDAFLTVSYVFRTRV